jgi:hypothetical protein
MMKAIIMVYAFLMPAFCIAQKQAQLAHGTVFGTKPNTTAMLNTSAVESFMGKKTRISTTIRGQVIRVTQPKGGWFELDAGNGKVIAAHFKVYNITIPEDLKGRTVIVEGVAEKQFIADDQQHLAGGNEKDKKPNDKINPKQKLTFEVTGLRVE